MNSCMDRSGTGISEHPSTTHPIVSYPSPPSQPLVQDNCEQNMTSIPTLIGDCSISHHLALVSRRCVHISSDFDIQVNSHPCLGECSAIPDACSMARDYLTIPATSVSVERVFSKSRRICINLRSSLKANTVTQALLTRVWIRSGLFTINPEAHSLCKQHVITVSDE